MAFLPFISHEERETLKTQLCGGLLWFPLNSKAQDMCRKKCYCSPETMENKTPEKSIPAGK